MTPATKVVRAIRWSCPKKCGLGFAAPSKTLLAAAVRQHNKDVHAQTGR